MLICLVGKTIMQRGNLQLKEEYRTIKFSLQLPPSNINKKEFLQLHWLSFIQKKVPQLNQKKATHF